MPDRIDHPEDHDVEGHKLASNDNEAVTEDDDEGVDVEGHKLAANDNETTIDDD